MDLEFSIPPADFLATWLEMDSSETKHVVEPICYLSRQGRKTRRVKDHFQNYMFITESGIDFTDHEFRSLLSAYLHLSYEFQLVKVEVNRFILTLETEMPTDYACAVLEEARMIHLAGSSVVCYATDQYAEGYYGGNLAYDVDDEVASMYAEVRLHGLPLHIRTIKTVERILMRYCIVHTVDVDCLSSKKLDCLSCACWVQTGTMFPKFVIVKVTSKFSENSALLSNMTAKHVQTYCVAVSANIHGRLHPTPTYQVPNDTSFFTRATDDDRIGCCFLRDVDVLGSRITELQESVVLSPRQLDIDMAVQEIAAELRLAVPCICENLTVQSIGVGGFIARAAGQPLPQLLHMTVGVGNDIQLCRQDFAWLPWSTSIGAVNESLPRRIDLCTTGSLPTGFFTPAVIEDLLSPFCMFDTEGYLPGSSPAIHDYRSVVWTDWKRSVPSIIVVLAAPTFCETTNHPKGEVIELTVMTAQNIDLGLGAGA